MNEAPRARPVITPGTRPRVSRRYRLQYENAQKAWVLLYPEGMVKLNGSAGEILQRCDGKRTVAQIVAQLEQAFDAQGLQDDVLGFMDIAHEQRWIDIDSADDTTDPATGAPSGATPGGSTRGAQGSA